MPSGLSPRLAEIVDALPLQPHMRILEIGCGPGAGAGVRERVRADLARILAEAGAAPVPLDVVPVDELERGQAAKLKVVKSTAPTD